MAKSGAPAESASRRPHSSTADLSRPRARLADEVHFLSDRILTLQAQAVPPCLPLCCGLPACSFLAREHHLIRVLPKPERTDVLRRHLLDRQQDQHPEGHAQLPAMFVEWHNTLRYVPPLFRHSERDHG